MPDIKATIEFKICPPDEFREPYTPDQFTEWVYFLVGRVSTLSQDNPLQHCQYDFPADAKDAIVSINKEMTNEEILYELASELTAKVETEYYGKKKEVTITFICSALPQRIIKRSGPDKELVLVDLIKEVRECRKKK